MKISMALTNRDLAAFPSVKRQFIEPNYVTSNPNIYDIFYMIPVSREVVKTEIQMGIYGGGTLTNTAYKLKYLYSAS